MMNEKFERRILLAHNQGSESLSAIEVLNVRKDKEEIKLLDVTKYNWSDPLEYEVPFVTTPEGIFQRLEGILVYISRPESSRRF